MGNAVLLHEPCRLITDKVKGPLGACGDYPWEAAAADGAQIHIKKGQPQHFRPHHYIEYVFFIGKAEIFRLFAPLFGGLSLAGAYKYPLAAEKLDSPHHSQLAYTCAADHIGHAVLLIIPKGLKKQ